MNITVEGGKVLIDGKEILIPWANSFPGDCEIPTNYVDAICNTIRTSISGSDLTTDQIDEIVASVKEKITQA